MKSFDLYFDESGNFEEYAFNEDCIVRSETPQKGASQLVGILAPSGSITDKNSKQILSLSLQKAGLTLEEKLHFTTLLKQGRKKEYSIILSEFLIQLEASKIQPVRLCNSARLGFGGKNTTYTSMVAEMVVRIFEELTCEYGGIQIELKIIAASVLTNGKEIRESPSHLDPIFINKDEYLKRLIEQIAFSAVRRGVAHNSNNWSIAAGFRFGSGQKERQLQMCDLLSNASNMKFRNCSANKKKQMKLLFGNYDFTLNRSDILKEIEQHIRNGFLAHAIQSIAENWDRPELAPDVRQKIKENCTSVISELARMPPEVRNIHLRQLADWGCQFLVERDLDMSDKIFTWVEKQITEPLCNAVNCSTSERMDWFTTQLLIHRLNQYNHSGNLTKARSVSDNLYKLFPRLAGQWEHAPLLTEAMTLRAVHLNDCFEYEEATRIMRTVDGFYSNLSSLLSDALPGVFPELVRSRQRGMALGTQLQSEMFAGLADPSRLDEARRCNKMAMDEFVSEYDRQRQYQYRCQIETFAGKLADARSWLSKSLGIENKTHMDLAKTIKALDGNAQGFALLHWTRIGMEAGRRGLQDELNQFIGALTHYHLALSLWVEQKLQEYPAHSIRRHLAISFAIAGRYKECRKINAQLDTLKTSDKFALTLIKLSGLLEVAVRLPDEQADTLRSLSQQLQALADNSAKFPRFHGLVQDMLVGIKRYVASSFKDDHVVLEACKKVGQ